ncbi:hypothetical protein GCM10025782_21970 [Pedococcus ginsenosidimutans]|uniref:Uncharacterized protein n=1 Tax=Pedococcus ginsenosidimutans TaxID=490570 RepID=A0ABP8Y7N3_9MICO
MPRVRDLLYRFRPAGGPGSATPAGVPADRERDLAAELEPVFVALAPTLARCREVVEQGRRDADGIRARDALVVERLLAGSSARAAAERAHARDRALAEADSDGARVEADADARAARLRGRLEELLPTYRAQAVASVESLLASAPQHGDAPGGRP